MRYWMLIFSFTMLSGCQPDLEDVQKAVSGGDTESLLGFLRHENKALHVPSLLGILAKAPKETQENALREVLTKSTEDGLIDAALGIWPTSPAVQSTFWATEAVVGFDIQRASRHIAVMSKTDSGRWSQLVTDQIPLISERFEKEPGQGAAFLNALLKTELSAESRAKVVLKATDFEKAAFAASDLSPQTVRTFLARVSNFQDDLQKAQPNHPLAGCLVVHSIADQITLLTHASLTSTDILDGLVPDATTGSCGDTGMIIKAAAAARLREVGLGENIGQRKLVSAARFCCWDSMWKECDPLDRPKAQCTENVERGDGWRLMKPAEYEYEPNQGPEQDADRLVSVANLLLLMRKLGISADPDLEPRLRRQAAAERAAIPDQKKVADLESGLKTQKEERKNYLYLGGYIVADHGSNTYEFAFLHAIPSCMGFSCPSPPNIVAGKHALLTTTETSFTTKGRFSIWASRSGTTEIKTTDGFNETWNKYIEVSKETVTDLDREITDGQKELSTLKAAMAKTGKGMETERRLLGKAVAQRFTEIK